MSTKKVKDGIPKQALTAARTKKLTETTKKETPKTKTILRVHNKKNEDDEEKLKKHTLKQANNSNSKRVSKPTQVKKRVSSTNKAPPCRPVTPPSSRVTKTQFFSSKKIYSHALKKDDIKKIKAVQKKTNPIVADNVSSDTSSMSERPRTATLRKGSIVNNNIVGPDAPKTKTKVPLQVKPEEPLVEYEDDFESYESDFEEYDSSDSVTNLSTPSESTETETIESESSELKSVTKRVGSAGTDEEKKMDSGNYELPESRHRQILDNIKETIEKENTNYNDQNKNNLGSLSDEGFEDGKSLQFINFLGAQRKYQHRKSVELRRKRGEKILSMIRLDHYSFTLLELEPVPYEEFIKCFGRTNSLQVSVQTGEDNADEEIQTEMIVSSNKWTQFPPCFSKIEENDNFWELYKCNYMGVGGDVPDREEPKNKCNERSLEEFLLRAGNLISNLLAEEKIQSVQTNKSNISFSRGHIVYDTQGCDFLQKRPINDVCFSANNSNKILTVHGKICGEDCGKSFICLWNASNVSVPEKVLVAFGDVLCCTSCLECPNFILGGLSDGTIVIWDTKKIFESVSEINLNNTIARSPTYTTDVSFGHCFKIISIQSVANKTSNDFFTHNASEVCSLDEEGEIIVWSIIFKEVDRGTIVENQGLAHWGSVIITINNRISLKQLYPEAGDFNCTDLALSRFDPNKLYISTNCGQIIHCLTSGGKTSVKRFRAESTTKVNCLEMCPFSAQYFVAGCDNGSINFYSRLVERPLKMLLNQEATGDKTKVEIIQWLYNRPFIFFTKDRTNTIHIWNLKDSDMIPVYSVPFKENVVRIKLSRITSEDSVPEQTYMVIATDKGLIYVHLLSEEYGSQKGEDFEKDKEKFFNYIDKYF